MTFITLVIPAQWRYNVSLSPHSFYYLIMDVKLSDFIYTANNTLTPEFCSHVIKKFDKDDRSHPGYIGNTETSRIDPLVKDSLDLNISSYPDWKDEDKVFFDCLSIHLDNFLKFDFYDVVTFPTFDNPVDSGYQIQKTSPNAGYSWHHDDQYGEYVIENGSRFATYIWYLNDVKEDGYTEFIDGTKIQPETGKIVIFPASWPYYHRGFPPKSETKYIVTGWMHSK